MTSSLTLGGVGHGGMAAWRSHPESRKFAVFLEDCVAAFSSLIYIYIYIHTHTDRYIHIYIYIYTYYSASAWVVPEDSVELLGVMVVTAARRLSSAGQVLVDYIVTVAVGAATWSQGSKIWKMVVCKLYIFNSLALYYIINMPPYLIASYELYIHTHR